MLFSSMTFIYVFLPIVLLLYLVSKKELHNFSSFFEPYTDYSRSYIKSRLNSIINVIDNKIIELDKRGKDNE